ncbi:MAG: hypothetical protein KatS3mg113_0303 [Planctomycetaceae bacterium]|nr:MAG: hypothetical protein KatS3mg113_0303 [Planctomycetaceae bacterium]
MKRWCKHADRPRSVSEWFRARARPVVWLLSTTLAHTSTQFPPFAITSILPATVQGAEKKPASTRKPSPVMHPGWIAQPGQAASSDDQATNQAGEESKIRLNYFAASWETVLKDLAEQSGSQLVADRVPSGRYTRRDRTPYSRSQAVRILNHEMEPLGFRIIEKGKYLVVIDLPSQRPQYASAVVPRQGGLPTQASTSVEDETQPANKPARQFTTVTPVPTQRGSSVSPRRSSAEPATIQLAQHETEGSGHPVPHAESFQATVFRTRHQKATDLARKVYRSFGARAELFDEGYRQLPGFRVHASRQDSRELFRISIDTEKNELWIEAAPTQTEAVSKLLSRLDAEDGAELQLVSSTRGAAEAAPQVTRELQRLREARRPSEGEWLAQAPEGARELPAAPVPPRGSLDEVVGNVKGEVAIEAVPDLGVIIIKGNEADVAQVMKVIRELEQLSELTAPTVHLLYLKHVNSDALAQLLSQVYESLTKFPGRATQPRQNVAILSVSKPNAILIVAPAGDLESILDLADQLDVPIDPQTEFEVFPLRAAIAARVVEKLQSLYQEPTGLGTRIVIQADERSNSVIVRGKPSDLEEIGALIRKIDREQTNTVSQVRVFPLKNAVANELAAILNAAIQSVLSPPQNQGASQVFGGQGLGTGSQVAEEFRDVPSTVLEIIAPDAEGQRRLRSGILANIRITPNIQANSLIVTAPEPSMNLIEQLIQALDKPTGLVAEIKVFTLANADATVIVQQLQGLFNAQVTGTGAGGFGGAQQRQQLGIQIAGAEDASSGLIPLRFSVDTRTNSVIAIGAADALRVVEALMLRLDESDIRNRIQSVYRLKNSPAANIANSVQQFLTSQQQLAQQDPNLFSSVEQLEREVIVVAEPVSNSLMISATPRYYDDVIEIIKKLDEQPKQVLMQALIVEVELEDVDEFGVEMGFQDSILFDRSIVDAANTFTTTTTTTQNNVTVTQTNIVSQAASPGFLFANPATPLGNNVSAPNPSRIGTQGLSNFSLGRVNGDLGFGGLVLSASSESVSLLLRALAQNRQVRVLSRPQIRAMDNQVALIQQGQNVPIVSGVTIAATGLANPTVQRNDAGVILEVTPRISPDGNIVMAIRAEKSEYNLAPGSGVPIFVDANTGNVIESPVKDISIAQTTISVPNGQTVVLGGLITSRTDNIHRRVPWLGDIPVVGQLFRYDFAKTRRTELLIFLTPRIITDDAYSEYVKEVEMARMHFIEQEAEEMHGPLRAVPAESGSPLFEGQLPAPGQGGMPEPPPAPQPPERASGQRSGNDSATGPLLPTQPQQTRRHTSRDDSGVVQVKHESASESPGSSNMPATPAPGGGKKPATSVNRSWIPWKKSGS